MYRPSILMLTAFIEVAPEQRDAIQAALADVVAATRAEDGCEDYGCYVTSQPLTWPRG
jgi:quinol monooxygenase YgiN